MSKRIVFVHPDGLHQILGHTGQLGLKDGQQPPVVVKNVSYGDQVIPFMSLFKVTTRACYYKEPLVPSSYTFHEAQQ